MILVHGLAQAKGLTPDYIAYRNRVVAANGSLGDADAVQKALDLLAQLPSIVQWLDARHGVGADWYSICGAQADAHHTSYGNPALGNDTTLHGQRTLAGGNWDAGITPDLGPGDSYSWGMRYFQPGPKPANGLFWGNRYGNTAHPNSNVWNRLYYNFWHSYFDGDTRILLDLPIGSWQWVWGIKDKETMTIYDATTSLGSAYCPLIGELPLGLAGGSDSSEITSGARFRYQTFVRATGVLTEAQRAAIMAI